MKKSSVKSIVLAITYKCNLMCKMCNIWQMKDVEDIPVSYFSNIKNVKYINLSGGEPFLRKDLKDIVILLKKNNPSSNIIISSNGFLGSYISSYMKELLKIDKNIGIRISIDGIGAHHDSIRGVNGSYEKAIKLIEELKFIGLKNLGIAFTLMDSNYEDLLSVYRLAKKMHVDFSMSMVQNSEIYFQKDSNSISINKKIENDINYIIRDQLRSKNLKQNLRAYYNYGLLEFLKTKKRILKSDAGQYSAFIDSDANVYISNISNLLLGNLKEKDLNAIIDENFEKIREYKEKNIESWSICNSRISIKRNWPKIILWIILNKLKNIF